MLRKVRDMLVILLVLAILGFIVTRGIKSEMEKKQPITEEGVNTELRTITMEPSVLIDPETGVNYLVYYHNAKAAMTLRVNSDGTPYVTELGED